LRCSSVLETERLRLRRPGLADLAEVHRLHADSRVWQHSPTGPHTDLRQSEQMLRRWLQHWDEHGYGYRLAEHVGRMIGVGGLMLFPGWLEGGDVLNAYYRFEPEAWGRGFAGELVAAALAEAPPLPAIARVRPSNAPSARVAERAGFERRPELDADGFEVWMRA
jgi:RimJ/RimL family protein N-acetyltransferase